MTQDPKIRDEAEQSILGAIFLRPECVSIVRRHVSPEMVFNPAWKLIYAAMLKLYESNRPIDHMTVGKAIVDAGQLDDVGGLTALSNLTEAVSTAANVEHYARIVRELYFQREMVIAAYGVVEAGRENLDDVETYLTNARANINRVASGFSGAEEIPSMSASTMRVVETAMSGKIPTGMMPTYIESFDRIYRGLPPTYILVGGYPGSGKTTVFVNLAFNIAVNLKARDDARRVLFFSLEVSRESIIQSALARYSGVNSEHITQGRLVQEEIRSILTAANIIHELPVIIDDRGGYDVARIRDIALQHHEESPIAAVFIDHIGKIRDKGKDRYHAMTNVSACLADLQKELRVPLIAASQLNRKNATDIAPPQLSNFRDSGMLEADARMAWTLHRPHYYFETGVTKDEPDAHEFCLSVVKNDKGRTGQLRLWIDLQSNFIGDEPTSDGVPPVYGGSDGY